MVKYGNHMKSIFVQIASYRDSECQWTIKDLFDKARHPDRVKVGVCVQYDPVEDRSCFVVSTRPDQVSMRLYHWRQSKGVCWARHHAQQLWQGEDFVLSIDSHMRFCPHWDERILEQFAECPSADPVLTHYPPPYTPPNHLDPDARPTVVCARAFNPNGTLHGRGVILDRLPAKPLRGALVAAGLMFGRSSIIAKVPYDPYLYFDQEELSLAVRLFTHGFDVYSPRAVVAYHFYVDQSTRPTHWADNPEWGRLHTLAQSRLGHLLGHTPSDDPEVSRELDKYGLGTARTLADFEHFCGIDLTRRVVSQGALQGKFIEGLDSVLNRPPPVNEASGGEGV
jgi:hypothetical protein